MAYGDFAILTEVGGDLLQQTGGAERRLILEEAPPEADPVAWQSHTVTVGTGTIGTRFLDKDWPITEGTTAGTTKQVYPNTLEEEPELP